MKTDRQNQVLIDITQSVGDLNAVEKTRSDKPVTRKGPEQTLLLRGVITEQQLDKALEVQQSDMRMSVLDALIQNGAIDEILALKTVAEYFKLRFRRVEVADVDQEIFELLPADYLKAKNVLPMKKRGETVEVAVANPGDIFIVDDLRRRLNHWVELVVAPTEDIRKVIEELSCGLSEQVEEILSTMDVQEDSVEVVEDQKNESEDLEKMAGESPVIRYVNYIISSAVHEGASDIHIEPAHKKLRVRFRMDGVLFEQSAPPAQMTGAIISRLKIMSKLDIAETRLPQDGRIRATVQGRSVDLRVSLLPTVHGEKCVIRILDNNSISVGLEMLGMMPETLAGFKKQIDEPNGIFLVTGPTGSGKSTTLYSAIQVLDRDKLNISTVEDPVEYELDGINQVHVQDQIGMTFSAALRSLLRQDPDVVMVGEIRDAETALIAVQASLTGHLVFSTLHTNDAPSAVTRLINIGVEPYLISAALNGVLAQRLVRRICGNCKTQVHDVPDSVAEKLMQAGASQIELYKGEGCDKCRHTGYKGRVGVYEILTLDDEMRDMITGNPNLVEFRNYAVSKGMKSLRTDGYLKVASGMTTVEEVLRVTENN